MDRWCSQQQPIKRLAAGVAWFRLACLMISIPGSTVPMLVCLTTVPDTGSDGNAKDRSLLVSLGEESGIHISVCRSCIVGLQIRVV